MYYYQILIFSLFLVLSPQVTQEKVVYHRVYTGTIDKRPVIVDSWNNDTGNKQIRETVDSENRVKKIEFLRDGKLTGHGYFPVAKITYEYIDNKIIETAYDKEEQHLYVDKYASHYQSVYYLDKDRFIEKVERISDFETVDPVWAELNMEPTSKADLEQESAAYFNHFYKDKPLEIEFYKYSYYKLDGIYPISKNYKVPTNYESEYLDTWIEKGIEAGVKKLYEMKNEK